jgi:hypothetical protein
MEILNQHETIDQQYQQLLDDEPKIISSFVPENTKEQRDLFLSGQIRNPDHNYDKLDAINFIDQIEKLDELERNILENPGLNDKHRPVYKEKIEVYRNRYKLMSLAQQFNHADSDTKEELKKQFMDLNIELYGKPKRKVYNSLLQEKLNKIHEKPLLGKAIQIKNELFEMAGYSSGKIDIEKRFVPSEETLNWMHDVVESLYDGMLSHIPDKEKFNPVDLKEVFQDILDNEFSDFMDKSKNSADGWRVDIEPAKSIDVKTGEKRIVIPDDRGELSQKKVKELVVHEIGVHVLRSIMGEDLDIYPLSTGLDGYNEAEEGIAKIMEQSLNKKYVEAGVGHYITAGIAYFDKKDFRDIFEIKWRMSALEKVGKDGELTDEIIKSSQSLAYGDTMRIMRGTDELPWFKDLSYYNGSAKMWEYLESISGDDIKFTFFLMGKIDPSNIKHERVAYEAKSKV